MKKLIIPILFAIALTLTAFSANASVIFRDDWNDLTAKTPTLAPPGVDWVIESGGFSANATAWEYPPSIFYRGESGTLMFSQYATTASSIHINFGSTARNTPVEVRLKLHQAENAEPTGFFFHFGLRDTISGKSILEQAVLTTAYYGATGGGWTGFNGYDVWGALSGGVAGTSLHNGWNYLKMIFNYTSGVQIWQAVDGVSTKAYTDPSLTYTLVAQWSNWNHISTLNEFYMDNGNSDSGARPSWKVDDVEIDANITPPTDTWMRMPDAPQTIYQSGVPHTDKNGVFRNTYDASASYLMRGLYATWTGTAYRQTWAFSDYAAAGFNCCMYPWNGVNTAGFDAAASAGVQMLPYYPSDATVTSLKNHPATLGWYVVDEPMNYWNNDMQGHWDAYALRKSQIKAIDPTHPVFINDCAWTMPPVADWWALWNTSGDVSMHDNYPITGPTSNTLSFVNGIPETVSLAVSLNNQSRPFWFIAQAFEGNEGGQNGAYRWRMPTPAQERCMVYTSIIHGATGIMYFVLDSYVSRNSSCIGIAPNPLQDYSGIGDLQADLIQKRASRDLWNGVKSLNSELIALRSSILSPTSTEPYEVYVDGSLPSISWNPIRTMLKTNPAGGLTLMLTNVDCVAQKPRVRFPNKNVAVAELYGSLGFTRSGDYIEMSCPAWDTRVLRIFNLQTIDNVKNQSLVTETACSGIVSAVFADCFYIESSDRTFGIRVNKAGSGLVAGSVVNVTGTPSTLDSQERCIVAGTVEQTATTTAVAPLAMSNKALGGGPFGLQSGVDGGVGLNNIGLLVRTSGRVTDKGTGWFKLDDGSGVSVKIYGSIPSGNPYVSVTGASFCERVGSLVLRVIQATSVQTL